MDPTTAFCHSLNRLGRSRLRVSGPRHRRGYDERDNRRSLTTKRFGSVTAVDGIGLASPEGTVFGLLGPSGVGKTATVRIRLR
jgi:ABC-type glutathione transport system ATPase component